MTIICHLCTSSCILRCTHTKSWCPPSPPPYTQPTLWLLQPCTMVHKLFPIRSFTNQHNPLSPVPHFFNTPLPNKQPHHFLQFSQQSPGTLNCCQFCYCYCLHHSFLDGPDEVHHNVYEIYWLCLGNARLLFQLDLNISCGLISSTFTSYRRISEVGRWHLPVENFGKLLDDCRLLEQWVKFEMKISCNVQLI